MTIAIGDIHGCLDALQRLVHRLPEDAPLVFLGDYVDRGPASAGVVAYLQRLGRRRTCTFLMGNHEAMMADAIKDRGAIDLWLFNGGDATLRSYGQNPVAWRDAPAAERARSLQAYLDFHAQLRLYHEDEDTLYVHAGFDPGRRSVEEQEWQALLWIREKFFNRASSYNGKQVVFGHTPTFHMGLGRREIFRRDKLFGIDTGCVYGGWLTALDTGTHELWHERRDAPQGGADAAARRAAGGDAP